MRGLIFRSIFSIVLASFIFVAGNPAQVIQVEKKLPNDYVSDNCSLFPDGKYAHCCVTHDEAYFFGGTKAERKAADKELYRCVKNTGGVYHKAVAGVMYFGVRTFAGAWLKAPFSWGFGKRFRSKVDSPVRQQ